MEKVESPAKVHVFYIDYGNVSVGSEVGKQHGRGPSTHRPLGQAHLIFRPPPPSMTDGDSVGLCAARPERLGNPSVSAQRPVSTERFPVQTQSQARFLSCPNSKEGAMKSWPCTPHLLVHKVPGC